MSDYNKKDEKDLEGAANAPFEKKEQEEVSEETPHEEVNSSEEVNSEESEDTEETSEMEDSTEATPSSEEKKPVAGVASFEKGTKSKTVLIAAVVFVVLVAGVIALQLFGYLGTARDTYVNDIHGYSFKYPQELQLVAEGNIPAELQNQGITSMSQLNLTSGDALLVETTEQDGGDNIVYTVLELSKRPSYADFETYKDALFASLDESKETNGIDYEVTEHTIGGGIESTEYTFEMEVPVDQAGNTRTGVFYDNVFETENGKAYSISFGYPKDIEGADQFLDIYRDVLSSFEPGSAESSESENTAGSPMEDNTMENGDYTNSDDAMTEEESATTSTTE